LPELSRVQLDALLQELLVRVGEVMTSRDRLRALLDAVVAIAADLDLRPTLERIVESACQLAGARYGALGVLGDDRTLVEFITHGLSPAEHAAIGQLPTGRGVLGLLIDDPRPVRMPDITQHPKSFGFPDKHPAMHSFLGVPVRIRERIYGNLYLAEKQGGAEFTDDDEQIVVALAAAAGVAIDNARLYSVGQRRQRWLAAASEITALLVGQVQRTAALRLIARRAREAAEAELVLVLLHDEDAGDLTVEAAEFADGAQSALVGATFAVDETQFADALRSRKQQAVPNVAAAAPWVVPLPDAPAIVVPLATSDALHGLLVVVSAGHGRDREEELAMLGTFAGQAALAFERALAQEEREMYVILEDRERIARDLHDVVIQRLFATGMQLQTAARIAAKREVADRVNAAVDDLDATIRDIRSAIFELRTPISAQLRTEIREIVAVAAEQLGFRPAVELIGPLDSAIPAELHADLLAVVREALSNVVRHAAASVVRVVVAAEPGTVRVMVADDGVGLPADGRRSGLANLGARADRLDGTFETRANDPRGTVVEWCVPL
jgi:signal transduction histidine kinase